MGRPLHQRILSRPGVAGLAAGLALAGLTAGGLAFAQTPAPAADPNGNNFVQRLAQHLGISESQLTQAVKDTRSEMIDEAVAQGRLPAERAEQLKNRAPGAQLGIRPFGGRGDQAKHGPRAAMQFIKAEFEAIAQFVNLTPDLLQTELKAGKSLAEIAQAQGTSRTDLVTKITGDITTKVNQAVTDGRLTQEQANQILAKAPEHVDRLIDQKHGAGMGRGPRTGEQPGRGLGRGQRGA